MAEFPKRLKVPSVCLPQRVLGCGFEQNYFMSNCEVIEMKLKLKSGMFSSPPIVIIE